jgi:hypothetical protein
MIDEREAVTAEAQLSRAEPAPQPAGTVKASAGDKVYDFKQDADLMDEETKFLYLMLRRRAQVRGDISINPDGKRWTQAQVVDMLGGQPIEDLKIEKRCCGE